ncbi:MAG TPA: alpha-amylase family protein [Acidobacteriaceae bacterium]|nr:alpha-amylase family protein [Acidobacteriaceae bacterium]
MTREMTRREFVEGAALVAAGTAALGPAGAAQAQAHIVGESLPAVKEVAMGSVFPYGAVYFRKSNPPAADWARDHKTAAQVGMNTFRHWVLWSAIEVTPGRYDWADYDKMMDLAHANGLKVILAEFTTCAPEWAFRRYAHARYLAADGSAAESEIGGSTAVGGFPGLCLDNEDARALAEKFLTAMVERYRNHPALLGYDVWNENSYPGGGARNMNCFCGASKEKLREWLRQKYGSLEAVAKNWGRYSCETWEDVNPPGSIGPYAQSLDWLEFRTDNVFRLLKWRVDLIRRLDPKHLVVAHGVAGTLSALPSSANNEWRSAELMDVWGLTWVASRHGNAPWMQFQAMDLARAGARGKPFWHAEAEGGPLWMQPQVIGHPREDGREPDAEDVRIWNLNSCACGARGILYPRWRPLLDGPLFGAFGPFGMDGSVTPRAEMAGKVAKWANAHADVWKAHPVKGDVGLLFVPESENFAYAQQGNTEYYAQSIKGAYQGFFDTNIQADLVALEDIDEYKLVYLPYPVMLKQATTEKLKAYVRAGGRLVCEGLPAYFGDDGHVGTVQPNFGLDGLFGAREKYVEFNPDLFEETTLEVRGQKVYGRYFRQDYDLAGGKAAGQWSNGNVAAVENRIGSGQTLLIGSFPGAGYYRHHGAATRTLFTGLLEWAGVKQQVVIDDIALQARLHDGPGGAHLWVTNPTRTVRTVTVTLAGRQVAQVEDVWGGTKIAADGSRLTMAVPPRDAVVVKLG